MLNIERNIIEDELQEIAKKYSDINSYSQLKTFNGPYNDSEENYRILAHLAIIYAYLSPIDYKNQIDAIVKILTIELDGIFNSNYKFRVPKGNKDSVNGLIGIAWVAEAVFYLSKFINVNYLKEKIIEILLNHPYQNGYWERVAPCGTKLGIDFTFNHQLWFCEQCLKSGNKDLSIRANDFLEKQIPNLRLYKDNIIKHYSNIVSLNYRAGFRGFVDYLNGFNQSIDSDYKYKKSVAYNSFVLSSLAGCYSISPKLECWNSRIFKRICQFKLTKFHVDILNSSKYGNSYNPSKPEYLFASTKLSISIDRELKNIKDVTNKDLLREVRKYEYVKCFD